MNILAIFAHPDDESFGPSGTLAKYAAEQHRVGLVTLTRGEAGSLGISKFLESDELARRRTQELQCAAEKLGISHLNIYDLPDNNLSAIPEEEGLQIIQAEINHFKPDVIITFHENGISGHPDHKKVTQWVLQTVDKMEISPLLFYYGILPNQVKVIPDRKLFAMPESDVTHKIEVGEYFHKKKAAIKCHKTQEELWKIFLNLPISYEEYSKWEYFMQVRPLPYNRDVNHHLFEEISTSSSPHKIL